MFPNNSSPPRLSYVLLLLLRIQYIPYCFTPDYFCLYEASRLSNHLLSLSALRSLPPCPIKPSGAAFVKHTQPPPPDRAKEAKWPTGEFGSAAPGSTFPLGVARRCEGEGECEDEGEGEGEKRRRNHHPISYRRIALFESGVGPPPRPPEYVMS
jgi:hypothetical protein